MRRILTLFMLFSFVIGLHAQHLSLDSCRNLAILHNKQLQMTKLSLDAANYEHKAAHTNFLPKLTVSGAYVHNEKETKLISDAQKNSLDNIGTTVNTNLTESMTQIVTAHPELATFAQSLNQLNTALPTIVNAVSSGITDLFRTNTQNVYLGTVTLTQPLYMGGKILAYNKITHYAELLAAAQNDQALQEVILSVDQTYWQVVALVNKQRVVDSYVALLEKLESDVDKMVVQGVSTKSDALQIKVKHNEAELSKIKVDDGVKLSRMLLCQICGLPMDSLVVLADEKDESLSRAEAIRTLNFDRIYSLRPEIKSLDFVDKIYNKKIDVTRSDYLPKIALLGNYIVSNPSCFSGFQNKFRGSWNVGVTFSMPVWSWREGYYKIRAAKAEASKKKLQLEDAKEQIQLQVNQALLRINEASSRLEVSEKNLESAVENLRSANLGFHEGVISTTTLLAANTAWLAAKSALIDAQIDQKLSAVYLKKSMGILK